MLPGDPQAPKCPASQGSQKLERLGVSGKCTVSNVIEVFNKTPHGLVASDLPGQPPFLTPRKEDMDCGKAKTSVHGPDTPPPPAGPRHLCSSAYSAEAEKSSFGVAGGGRQSQAPSTLKSKRNKVLTQCSSR